MYACTRGHGTSARVYGCLHIIGALDNDRPMATIVISVNGMGDFMLCSLCESALGQVSGGRARLRYISDHLLKVECMKCFWEWLERHGLELNESDALGVVDW